MKFTHIILTRFNVRHDNSSMPPSQKWMDKRIHLFENYCFPSIVNQSNQEFKWIVYIDRQTEPKYVEIFQRFSRDLSNILIIPTDSWEQVMKKNLHSDVLKLVSDDSEFVITTRLDNDDAVHENFIQIIQQNFLKFVESNKCKDTKFAINLTKGYCLQVEPNYELTLRTHVSNPFISLVESLTKDKHFLTVLHLWHDNYATQTDFPLIQVDTIPYWIQVIHSTNISNQVVGYPIMDKNKLADFGIDFRKINLSTSSYTNFVNRRINHLYRRFLTGIARRIKLISS